MTRKIANNLYRAILLAIMAVAGAAVMQAACADATAGPRLIAKLEPAFSGVLSAGMDVLFALSAALAAVANALAALAALLP
jgi:hypothetical protein